MTGLRPNHTRVWENRTHFREHHPDLVTLPQLFQQAGYFVARVGKLYHYGVPGQIGTAGLDDVDSWQQVVNPRGRDVADEELIYTIRPDAKGSARFGGTLSWLAAKGNDSEQTDGIGAAAATELLETHRDKPFFLAVGFYRPHTPYVAPRKYFDLYPTNSIELPQVPEDVKDRFPAAAITTKPEEAAMTDTERRDAGILCLDHLHGCTIGALARCAQTSRTGRADDRRVF